MEQETSPLEWAILEDNELWKTLVKPYLEGEKNRIFLELCGADTPDKRAILQGQAIAIADILLKPQVEAYYKKEKDKAKAEEEENGRRDSRGRTARRIAGRS